MNDTLRAALYMIGAIVSFPAMAIAGRQVASELDTFELMMFRSLIGIVIVLIAAAAFGKLGHIRLNRPGLHVLRNVAHFTGQNLWFYALPLIPLAQVFALEFTQPIWVLLLSPLLLGERLTVTRVFAAFVGFIGILIITRPGATHISVGVIAAAVAACAFAFTTIFTKKLTRTEHVVSILLFLTIIQAILGVIAAGWDGDIRVPSSETWPWVMVVAIGGLVAHFCLTRALSLAPATVIIPIDFTRLPIIALIGLLLYNEPLEWPVLAGAILIFAANYVNIWQETRKATHL